MAGTTSFPDSEVSFGSSPVYYEPPFHLSMFERDFSIQSLSLSSLEGDSMSKEQRRATRPIGLRDRISCYEWTFFTMTMATGGIANIVFKIPFHSDWVKAIGIFFFLMNLVLFFINCIGISLRFYLNRGSFSASFTNPDEALYIPSLFVTIALILINICEYGVPSTGIWLLRTLETCFWIYTGFSIVASAAVYLIIWSTCTFPIQSMTPIWVFPAYPLLLTAPLAANLIDAAALSNRNLALNTTAMVFGAAAAQGAGCLIAFMISAAFVYRLMTHKLPDDIQRPGVFISIGPFGFTASSIVQLGNQANRILPPNFLQAQHSADIIRIVSMLVGLWLWGLSMWFFLVSVGSLGKYFKRGNRLPFRMSWWSFVFPNTALVTATQAMAKAFDSDGLRMFGTTVTVLLVAIWIAVFIVMVHNMSCRKLLWPAPR
ncbi:hypothetical protein VHEMI05537 [[Torrubiella] hemipterigena]|uniref:Malic acid transport protein n=1 Tax=[Torrubiella] hemipterigena TaxID=1531966 RepID=A0A0A1TJ25_9HYPO|nr:hypothetical protein VHEMI05537 [[Torrubiella] hemipterigena]